MRGNLPFEPSEPMRGLSTPRDNCRWRQGKPNGTGSADSGEELCPPLAQRGGRGKQGSAGPPAPSEQRVGSRVGGDEVARPQRRRPERHAPIHRLRRKARARGAVRGQQAADSRPRAKQKRQGVMFRPATPGPQALNEERESRRKARTEKSVMHCPRSSWCPFFPLIPLRPTPSHFAAR